MVVCAEPSFFFPLSRPLVRQNIFFNRVCRRGGDTRDVHTCSLPNQQCPLRASGVDCSIGSCAAAGVEGVEGVDAVRQRLPSYDAATVPATAAL